MMAAKVLPTQSFLTVNGPVKVEYVEFLGTLTTSTGTTQTEVSDGDSFDSKMVGPKFVIVTNSDDGDDTSWTATISGKTITLTSTGASDVALRCIVVGH
jgi:hypothetical protein